MKKYKIIIVAAIWLLVLPGCANKQYTYNESDAPRTMDNFNQADIIGRITAIKNGLAPKMKPGRDSADSDAGQGQAEEAKRIKLENLTGQFDGAVIKTSLGNIAVKFYAKEAPVTVNNFLNLAQAGFYNGIKFHRAIKDFMIQAGDPLSQDDNWSDDGQGGPGYQFQDEINGHKLVKGSLAMANSGPNTNGSQFFIVTKEAAPWLDGKHTNFGYVISGRETVEKIEQVKVNENYHPTEEVVINSIEMVKSEAAESLTASSTPTIGAE